MNFVKTYFLARLQEASTWRGIVTFAITAIGYSLDPQELSSWVAAAVAISGAMKITMKDGLTKTDTKEPTP